MSIPGAKTGVRVESTVANINIGMPTSRTVTLLSLHCTHVIRNSTFLLFS
jgi:hypothetical protein